ncbi:MAG TPA: hypothetical protein VN709_13445 [Terriglobales bacterium]|nr:hypothetical protein [Terriglobales bacterium]
MTGIGKPIAKGYGESAPTSNNFGNQFGNQGLAGQKGMPILTTTLGTSNNQTTATQLVEGAAGAALQRHQL